MKLNLGGVMYGIKPRFVARSDTSVSISRLQATLSQLTLSPRFLLTLLGRSLCESSSVLAIVHLE